MKKLSQPNSSPYKDRIYHPNDGVVGRLPYHLGDYIGPSITEGLTTIADTSEMYIFFSLTEREVTERIAHEGSLDKMIAAFPSVVLRLSNQIEYAEKGKVESISGIVDSHTGSLQLRAIFPNPDGLLLSGGTGSLVITENMKMSLSFRRNPLMKFWIKYMFTKS